MVDQFANAANRQGYGKYLRLDVLPTKIDTLLKIIHAIPLLSAPALKSSLALASPLLTLITVLRTFELANEPSHLLMPVGQLPHRRKELFTILAGYDWK